MKAPDALKIKPKVRRYQITVPWIRAHDFILLTKEKLVFRLAASKDQDGYHATCAKLGIKVTTPLKNELLKLILDAIADKWRNKDSQPKEYQDYLNLTFRQVPPDVATITTNEM